MYGKNSQISYAILETIGQTVTSSIPKGCNEMKKSTKIIILVVLILMCILMAIGGISMGIALA